MKRFCLPLLCIIVLAVGFMLAYHTGTETDAAPSRQVLNPSSILFDEINRPFSSSMRAYNAPASSEQHFRLIPPSFEGDGYLISLLPPSRSDDEAQLQLLEETVGAVLAEVYAE